MSYRREMSIKICREKFFVACYATLHPAMSVGRSVGRSPFYFSAYLAKCPSALVPFSSTAPALFFSPPHCNDHFGLCLGSVYVDFVTDLDILASIFISIFLDINWSIG